MFLKRLTILLGMLVLLVSCKPVNNISENENITPDLIDEYSDYMDVTLSPEKRAEILLSLMSLEEKIGQMTLIEKGSLGSGDVSDYFLGGVLSGGGGYPYGHNSPEGWYNMVSDFQEEALSTRLGIPMIYGVDAVHGHNNVNGAVIFPHNIGLGATRNPELISEIGKITAIETKATGIPWNYAPVLAVVQDIRWGRSYESYGEDPELVGTLGAAFIEGLQGEGIAFPNSVAATAKHFVGDGGTEWGSSKTANYMIDQGDTIIDEEGLRVIHLAPYFPALEAGAEIVMVSYSSWNGEKMHGHDYLINEVLKAEMGFEGFVVSDWKAIDQINNNYYESVVSAINAGIDMNMVPQAISLFIDTLESAVENGDVSIERIDDAVRRILTIKFKMGLFEKPMPADSNFDLVGSESHRMVAQEAVSQSLVLLKNKGDFLPIEKDLQVFIAGLYANKLSYQMGGWTMGWQGLESQSIPATTIVEGFKELGGDNVEFNRFGNFEQFGRKGDVGIVVIGEGPYAEGQGDDADLNLESSEIKLIEKVAAQVDKVIVIILSGRPLIITDQLELADVWIAAWLPGSEAQGIAANIYGDHPFTGLLPVTWPVSMDQLPLGNSTEAPLFPYGYGLTTD
jgi:beta-glucosidase